MAVVQPDGEITVNVRGEIFTFYHYAAVANSDTTQADPTATSAATADVTVLAAAGGSAPTSVSAVADPVLATNSLSSYTFTGAGTNFYMIVRHGQTRGGVKNLPA